MGEGALRGSLADFLAERPPGSDEDVHMLVSLVDHVIERFSRPGDLVLDPFAGYGTTLERAVALGRRATGIELLPERARYMSERVPDAVVTEGDARALLRVVGLARGSVNLVLSSPPYMTRNGHEADPLTAYELDNGHYGRYLAELGLVAAQCAKLLAPGGHLVWNVADIRFEGVTTRLIDDCERVLRRVLTFVERIDVEWDTYPHDLVADALLVYRYDPPATAS